MNNTVRKKLIVALAGNPNCGKTSIFNNLTGSRQYVGNWPGVTVEKKEGPCIFGEYDIRVVDLPGTYSLTAYSIDETIARNFVIQERPDVVINVVDASNLERNLYLTTQMLEMEVPLVLALNMIDRAESRGFKIDIGKLSEFLGVPVVTTIGHRNQGTRELLEALVSFSSDKVSRINSGVHYGEEIEEELEKLETLIKDGDEFKDYPSRWVSLKLLEGDEEIGKIMESVCDPYSVAKKERIRGQLLMSQERITHIHGEDAETVLAEKRYGFISGIMKKAVTRPVEDRLYVSDRIDGILTNRVMGLPIFFGMIWLMFKLTFTASEPFMLGIESIQTWVGNSLGRLFTEGSITQGLVVDGIIGGVGSVLVFVPIIWILFFCMALLEDSGYMARAAYIMDEMMQKIGLHGKSFIPMVLGFGCNLPGIMATRTIETTRERIITILIVPFMSCGARLPIYTLFIGAFFGAQGGTVLFSLYLIGILASIILAKLVGKYMLPGGPSPLLLELPPYRIPNLRGALIHTWQRGKVYLKKAGTVILVGCSLVWFGSNFPWTLSYSKNYDALMKKAETEFLLGVEKLKEGTAEYSAAEDAYERGVFLLKSERASEKIEKSYIGTVGKIIEPLVKPLGFDWKAGVSLMSGFVAKEIVVGTLGTIYAVGEPGGSSDSLRKALQQDRWPDGRKIYTPLTAYTFMVFCLLYIPCVATIGVIFQETNSWQWTLFAVFYNVTFAWIVSFGIYQVGSLFGWG
ncbi:MAG: ferrous iron transport protein B [Deltaproteobacteria bacterium]|nr:ferrous iron transport protein B [Deltaproteobacteria bacterium]